jgi:hypothetical protein
MGACYHGRSGTVAYLLVSPEASKLKKKGRRRNKNKIKGVFEEGCTCEREGKRFQDK